jgi:diguanylate cyclase (GGDEF)-like protein
MRGHQTSKSAAPACSGERDGQRLFLLDVDHFKHINDTYGHGAGDAVLREIAKACARSCARPT